MNTLETTRTEQLANTLDIVVEHQPRERAIHCTGCATLTWQAQHGYCDDCIRRGHLRTTCACREGVLAAHVQQHLSGQIPPLGTSECSICDE